MQRGVEELVGAKVKLVPMTMEHVAPLFDAASDERIWAYLTTKVNSLEQMEQWVQSALEAKARKVQQPFVVVDVSSDTIVGSTRYLNISAGDRNLEIGWTWYHPSVWRTHVNTESKYLLLKHAFEDLGVVRVQFCADSRNQRSNEAILRLGAVQEGVLRKHRILSDGYIRDTCVYSIVKEEWPDIKSRLESFLK